MQPCNRIIIPTFKLWNNKFYYKVASCWLFLLIHTTMHGSMNIKYINAKQAIEIHAYKLLMMSGMPLETC